MRRFGLIGSPLTHSFSQRFFTEKFQREGRSDCRYDLFPLSSIDRLPELLSAEPELEGLNVTIPYKQQVLAYLNESAIPSGVGACNCIRIRGGRLTGYNTDIDGFEQSLRPYLIDLNGPALVLGTGGASAAVRYVLDRCHVSFQVVGRTTGGGLTYEQLTKELIAAHPLLINTTPLGQYPATEGCPPIPFDGVGPSHVLYDLVYNPEKTLFLQRGEERGARIKNGLEMLRLQAERSWQIWDQA